MRRLTLKLSNLFFLIVLFNANQYSSYPQSSNDVFNCTLLVCDMQEIPVKNATVKYWYAERWGHDKIDSTYTDVKGNAIISVKSTEVKLSRSKIFFTVSKEGYCQFEGELELPKSFGNNNIDNKKAKKPILNQEDIHLKKIILKKLEDSKTAYRIKVIGLNETPIENVNLIINTENNLGYYSSTTQTNLNGLYDGTIYSACTEEGFRPIQLRITADKEGYFKQDTFIDVRFGKENFKIISLIAETDYLHDDFLNSSESKLLAANITSFTRYLILESILSDCIIEYNSIYLEKFKGSKYLSITFKNLNEYNSLKLNHYDIGKEMFDEVVRKILNPLNDNLGGYKSFYGYKLIIKTSERDFSKDKNLGKDLEYIFYIPQKTVIAYKNLDITGQQLINDSIILFNGERIDLKLQ